MPSKLVPRNGRRIIVDPANVLPFEITPRERALYDKDDYKYVIHYMRAFPNGKLPAMEYLLVSFHPLIVTVAGMYAKSLNMEWRDLLSFTMQKFIELVYRFKLDTTLFFREYIKLALRRSVRDRVLFDSRRHLLNSAISLNSTDHSSGSTCGSLDTILSTEDLPECFKEVHDKITSYALRTNEFSELDRKIFKLRFVQNLSMQDTCQKLNINSAKFTERNQRIKTVLCDYTTKFLI